MASAPGDENVTRDDMSAEVAQLIRLIAVRDPASLRALITRSGGQIAEQVARQISDQDVAEVVLAQVYADVWEQADDFDALRDSGMHWLHDRASARLEQVAAQNDVRPRAHGSFTEGIPGAADLNFDAIFAEVQHQIGLRTAATQIEQPVAEMPPPANDESVSNVSAAADRGPAGVSGEALLASDDDDDDFPRKKNKLGVRLVAAVAILAMLAGVGAGLFGVMQTPEPVGIVALEQITQAPDAQFATASIAGGGQAGVSWSLNASSAVLVTLGLGAAPEGSSYEAWVFRGDDRISLGTFAPDENGDAAVLMAGDHRSGDRIVATVEKAGGSPNGVPSELKLFEIRTGSSGATV